MLKVVPTLFGTEHVADFADSFDQLIECSCPDAPEMGFQF